MSDDAAALRKMLTGLAGSAAKDADVLLMQVSPSVAALLELCAIPHTFDATVVRVLDPTASAELIDAFLTELPSLPAVSQTGDVFILHDVVREQMFQRWLSPERWVEFSTVSRRLVEHFAAAFASDPGLVEANHSIIVFHQIGAAIESGFLAFQGLYGELRAASRYSACETLVRLVGEYHSVLSPLQLAWLTYYEAQSASDSRNPARAASLLTRLAAADLPPDLKVSVLVHLSAAMRETNYSKAAQVYARQALQLASTNPEGRALLHLVHQELGLIARQQGNVETAEDHLNTAIELARSADHRLAVAIAYNSMGTMFQKMMPRRAVEMFEASAAWLNETTDLERMAQVLNNLGLAYANAGEWEKSRASYERSLDIKRAAADLYGQALTQLNVARVYRAQQNEIAARNALTESAVLFESLRDLAAAATARSELARILLQAGATDDAANEVHAAVALFVRAHQPDAGAALEREFGLRRTRSRSWFAWMRWS